MVHWGVWVGIGVVAVITIIALSGEQVPKVVFVNDFEVIEVVTAGNFVSYKVNVENLEEETMGAIKVVTTLDEPNDSYIEIRNPEIDIGELEPKARSGEKKIEFQTFQSVGNELTFYGESQVIVNGTVTSNKLFEITILPKLPEPQG